MIITYDIETFYTMAIGEPELSAPTPQGVPVAEARLQTIAEATDAEAFAGRDFSNVIAGQVLAKLSY